MRPGTAASHGRATARRDPQASLDPPVTHGPSAPPVPAHRHRQAHLDPRALPFRARQVAVAGPAAHIRATEVRASPAHDAPVRGSATAKARDRPTRGVPPASEPAADSTGLQAPGPSCPESVWLDRAAVRADRPGCAYLTVRLKVTPKAKAAPNSSYRRSVWLPCRQACRE